VPAHAACHAADRIEDRLAIDDDEITGRADVGGIKASGADHPVERGTVQAPEQIAAHFKVGADDRQVDGERRVELRIGLFQATHEVQARNGVRLIRRRMERRLALLVPVIEERLARAERAERHGPVHERLVEQDDVGDSSRNHPAGSRRKAARPARSTQTMTSGASRWISARIASACFSSFGLATSATRPNGPLAVGNTAVFPNDREARQELDLAPRNHRAGKRAKPVTGVNDKPRGRPACHVRAVACQLDRPAQRFVEAVSQERLPIFFRPALHVLWMYRFRQKHVCVTCGLR